MDQIKSTQLTKHLPCIVHTAVLSQETRQKAAQAGAVALVSKLNSDHLLSEVALVLNGEKSSFSLKEEASKSDKSSKRYVTFTMSKHWFALPMDAIKEVSTSTQKASLPGGNSWMNQVTYFRGQVIPVLDLGKLFSLTEMNGKPIKDVSNAQFVVENEGNQFAILSGKIGEVIDVSSMEQGEGVVRDSQAGNVLSEYSKTVLNDKGRLITILDLNSLTKLTIKNT